MTCFSLNGLLNGRCISAAGKEMFSFLGTVPGCVHTDLIGSRIPEDLYYRDNADGCQWIEECDWTYTRTFHLEELPSKATLVFEGLDTYADIYLNGTLIGSADNMLIAHEFSAENLICGKNELVVHIKPVFLESRKHPIGAGSFVHLRYNAESLSVRKAAHMFGWDIMPRILSGGIWRSVRLETVRVERIEEIYMRTSALRKTKAILRLYSQTALKDDFAYDYSLKVEGVCKDSRFEKDIRLWNASGTEHIEVEAPYLWWTKDMGEQNLYTVTATLMHGDEVIDRVSFRTGVRTFELKRTSLADENGEFCFYLNGEPFFFVGICRHDLGSFEQGQTLPDSDIERDLRMIKDLGANCVRLVHYPHDKRVVEMADRLGLFISEESGLWWSDMHNPAITEGAIEVLEKTIHRDRSHACVAFWMSFNECPITVVPR